jgi:hypothetical protein
MNMIPEGTPGQTHLQRSNIDILRHVLVRMQSFLDNFPLRMASQIQELRLKWPLNLAQFHRQVNQLEHHGLVGIGELAMSLRNHHFMQMLQRGHRLAHRDQFWESE